MTPRKLIAVAAALGLVAGGSSAAVATAAPNKTTVKAVQTLTVKINRFIKDGLRWNKDVYSVKSGGELKIVQKAAGDGPHTFTVVKKSDMPKTAKQILNCKICEELGKAHGADPSSEGPPQFTYLENGKGQNDVPNYDQPGDSAFFGAKNGDSVTLPVTAKKGTTLHVLCLIHPWMQAKVRVKWPFA